MNFIILSVLVLAFFAHAASAENTSVVLDAIDVDCRKCHTDPHVIHSNKGVECQRCHGETLDIKIPKCISCHSGPIHDVHKRKVDTQPCSSCHSNIQGKHNSMLGDSVCEHCHKDLINIHGGEVQACSKCHGTVQRITKPSISASKTVICESCHQAESVATIHGSKDDAQTCYRCHREGVGETETVKIPHIIHVPKIECMTCHWDLKVDSIIIPKCSKCHTVDQIHSFPSIGKGMKGSVECSICHPNLAIQKSMGELTEIPGRVSVMEGPTNVPTSTPPIAGFGLISSLIVFGLLYVIKFRK